MKTSILSSAAVNLAPAFLVLLGTGAVARALPIGIPAQSSVFAERALDVRAGAEPLEHVLYDEPGDGRVWALGSTWKASFGEDGAVYFPRVGPNEPRRCAHHLSPDR